MVKGLKKKEKAKHKKEEVKRSGKEAAEQPRSAFSQSSFARAFRLWNTRSLAVIVGDILTYGAIFACIALGMFMLNPLLGKLQDQTAELQMLQTILSTADPASVENMPDVDVLPGQIRWTIIGIIAAFLFSAALLIILFFTFQYLGWTFLKEQKIRWRGWLRFLLSQLYLFLGTAIVITVITLILRSEYKIYAGVILGLFWLCTATIFAASFDPERTAWKGFMESNAFFWRNPSVLLFYLLAIIIGTILATMLYMPFTNAPKAAVTAISMILVLILLLWSKTFIWSVVKKRMVTE